MLCLFRSLLVVTAALALTPSVYAQAPLVYEDEAALLATVGTPTLIDFEGIVEPGEFLFLGNPGMFSQDGLEVISNTQMFVQNIDAAYGSGSFLSPQGFNPQLAQFNFPANTVAVGISYGYADTGSVVATANINDPGEGSFELTAPAPGTLGFIGFKLETGIDRIVIIVDVEGIDYDNIWYVVDPDPPPSGSYTDETTFLAAVESPTLIDFEGVADPGEDLFVGDPGFFADEGVEFSNNSQMFVRNQDFYGMASHLSPQGADPQILQVNLPVSTVAFGFSYGYAAYGPPSATVEIDGLRFVLPPEEFASMKFFGFVSDTPVESFTVTVNGGILDIDNFWFRTDSSIIPDRYTRESDFLAAVSAPKLIDFEGFVDPDDFTEFGNPGAFVDKGIRITNRSQMFIQNNDLYGTLSYLSPQGGSSQNILIQLPPGTLAVGFSYSSALANAVIDGVEIFSLPAQPTGTLGFFGVIREQPINAIEIVVAGPGFDIDNLWFVRAAGNGLQGNVPGGGTIDTDFGTDGVLQLVDLFGSDNADVFGLGIQPGGGIVIAGTLYNDGVDPEVIVARLNIDGSLDTSFGDNGLRSVFVGAGGGFAWDLAVQTDGSVLVSGRGARGTTDTTSYIFKLDADGDLDDGFGTNGVFTENLFTGAALDDGFERIVQRQDGNLLLGAAGLGIHQLTPAGVRDSNFGASGTATPLDGSWGNYGLAEAADNKIVFGGGTAFFEFDQPFITGRYLADGSHYDTSYGNNGISIAWVGVNNDELLDLQIDAQGRIVAVGFLRLAGTTTRRRTAVVRFLPDGQLDESFGYGGIRILDGLPLIEIFATRILLRPDGGILLAGTASRPQGFPSPEIYLLSLHEDGTLDESFAGQGWLEIDAAEDNPQGTISFFLLRDAMAVHPSGKIVVLSWKCACMTLIDAPGSGGSTAGDHDGDGRSDIFFRNILSGANQMYLMDGAAINQNLPVSNVGNSWNLVGRADYTGDGNADLLWQFAPTGAVWLFEMDGNTVVSSQFVATIADSNWKVVGHGDYNGDGKADILWYHAVNGTVWLYEMDGNVVINSTGVGVVPDTDWQIVGSGDYDGDGNADILWRNGATGANWMYLMDGAGITTSVGVSVTPDLNWQIVASGDYDGDGKADIFWRHATQGTNWMYLMDGTSILSSGRVSVLPDTNWVVVGEGDYDGDGRADVLWRNLATGSNYVYLMDGLSILSNASVSTVADQNWKILDGN